MPIRPEDRHRYPPTWPGLSLYIRRERAESRCECTGECGGNHGGRCDAPDRTQIVRRKGEPWIWRRAEEGRGFVWLPPIRVVLTVAHLDRTPENCDPVNLRAFCQRCHLVYDGAEHGKRAAETRKRRARQALEDAGQLDAFHLLRTADAP